MSSPMKSDADTVEKILKNLRTMRAAAYQCDKERLVKVERLIEDQQQDIDDLRKQRRQFEQAANSLQSQLLAHGIQPRSRSTRSRSRSRSRSRGRGRGRSRGRDRRNSRSSSSSRNRSSSDRGRSGSRGKRRESNGDTRHVHFADQTLSSSPPLTTPPPPQAANIGRERQPRHYHMSKDDLRGRNRSRNDEFGATRDRLADRFDARGPPGMPPFPGGSPPMPPMHPMSMPSVPSMPMPMPPMPIPSAMIHPPIVDPIGITPMMFSAAWGEEFIHGGGPPFM